MDEMREREKRVTLAWDGCVGVMVLLRLMVGGLEERPCGVGRGQGRRQGWADGLGRDLSFSQAVRPPRCSAVAGAGADDRQTALNLGRRLEDPLEWAKGAK